LDHPPPNNRHLTVEEVMAQGCPPALRLTPSNAEASFVALAREFRLSKTELVLNIPDLDYVNNLPGLETAGGTTWLIKTNRAIPSKCFRL